MKETYELIQALRDAEDKWYDERGLEGACWSVDIRVSELDSNFEQVLKRVIDEGRK